MLYRSLAALLLAGSTLTAAEAADIIEVPQIVEVPVITGWTGPYAGASLGYGVAETEVFAPITNGSVFNGFDETVPILGPEPDARGGTFSAHVGFNHAFGAFVVGGEIEGGYLGLQDEAVNLVPFSQRALDRADDDFVSVDFALYGTATAKAGLAIDRVFAYAKGGAAAARVQAEYGDLDGPVVNPRVDPFDVSEIDEYLTGYVVGGGAAFAVTETVSVNAEYNYIDLDDIQSSNRDGDLYELRNDIHLLKVGVSARF